MDQQLPPAPLRPGPPAAATAAAAPADTLNQTNSMSRSSSSNTMNGALDQTQAVQSQNGTYPAGLYGLNPPSISVPNTLPANTYNNNHSLMTPAAQPSQQQQQQYTLQEHIIPNQNPAQAQNQAPFYQHQQTIHSHQASHLHIDTQNNNNIPQTSSDGGLPMSSVAGGATPGDDFGLSGNGNQPGYTLLIRQQPTHARCCGFGSEKLNTRPLDPCLILQLALVLPDGSINTSLAALGPVASMVAHCSLVSEAGEGDRSCVVVPAAMPVVLSSHMAIPAATTTPTSTFPPAPVSTNPHSPTTTTPSSNPSPIAPAFESTSSPHNQSLIHPPSTPMFPVQTRNHPPKWERTLSGTLVSSCHYLTDLSGSKGAYFCFSELSIRVEGTFRMLVLLSSLNQMESRNKPLATALTDPIQVFNARDYPGLGESTELSKHFADQGIKISIRRKGRRGEAVES
ncbi:velvet factor-domain-containing protein [Phlyctochytrium arcticum]|nr:velvet factor-domain-containing protein [Phlyctochytrium arcticum]